MSDIYNDEQQQTTTEVVPPPSAPQLPDSVAALVGEGKKYATIEKALEALGPSQEFIEQLKAENAELREKVTKGVAIDEVYETVQDLLKQQGKTSQSVEVSEDSIAAVLDRKLQEREAQKQAEENVKTFKQAMQKKFGDKEKEQWTSKATELGVSETFLSDLVRKSPAAALQLFGLSASSAQAPRPSQGTVNSAALQAQPQRQPDHKPVMFGAKTADVLDAWRKAAPKSD